jgi:hypothetical protein
VTTATKPVMCSCGQEIPPYVIGDHSYQAKWCPACIDVQEAEEKRISEEGKLVRLGFQRRYANSDFDNLHDPKPSPAVIEAASTPLN